MPEFPDTVRPVRIDIKRAEELQLQLVVNKRNTNKNKKVSFPAIWPNSSCG